MNLGAIMENEQPSISNVLWGLFLVVLGLYFLAPLFGLDISINFGLIWPFFMIVPAVGLWATCFASSEEPRDVGIVIPATILSVLGGLFLVMGVTDWKYIENLSFIFPFSVALAFWAAWLLGNRQVGFLIPAAILTLVSMIVFGAVNYTPYLLPLVLIGVGAIVIFRGKGSRPPELTERNDAKPSVEEK